jgi:uracil-DNA glycosylase
MDKSDRVRALEVVQDQVRKCTSCSLCKNRTQTVFGEGNPDTVLVLCGEGPGQTEDETGRPFVGRAGKLLDNMIRSIGLEREDVYICNVVKCRPPGNRKPKPEEMDVCKSFLIRQLQIIQPKVIVALGNTALGGLTGQDGGITNRCGHWEEMQGIKLMPCYHPSALLRNPNWKDPAWHALQKVKSELAYEKYIH